MKWTPEETTSAIKILRAVGGRVPLRKVVRVLRNHQSLYAAAVLKSMAGIGIADDDVFSAEDVTMVKIDSECRCRTYSSVYGKLRAVEKQLTEKAQPDAA